MMLPSQEALNETVPELDSLPLYRVKVQPSACRLLFRPPKTTPTYSKRTCLSVALPFSPSIQKPRGTDSSLSRVIKAVSAGAKSALPLMVTVTLLPILMTSLLSSCRASPSAMVKLSLTR